MRSSTCCSTRPRSSSATASTCWRPVLLAHGTSFELLPGDSSCRRAADDRRRPARALGHRGAPSAMSLSARSVARAAGGRSPPRPSPGLPRPRRCRFSPGIEASDSYSVKTLRETDERSGRRVSLDRVHFAASPAGGFLEQLWHGERVRATGSLPERPRDGVAPRHVPGAGRAEGGRPRRAAQEPGLAQLPGPGACWRSCSCAGIIPPMRPLATICPRRPRSLCRSLLGPPAASRGRRSRSSRPRSPRCRRRSPSTRHVARARAAVPARASRSTRTS